MKHSKISLVILLLASFVLLDFNMTYNYKIYVVAEIKKDDYGFTVNKYIFCGIPFLNWTSFQFGSYGASASYGERFHKYIFDYKCDCK